MADKVFNKMKKFLVEALGINENAINPENSIFKLGIDSVMMITVVKEINDLFHVDLSLSDVTFKYNTLEKICIYIEENMEIVSLKVDEIKTEAYGEPERKVEPKLVHDIEPKEPIYNSNINPIYDIILKQKNAMENIFTKQLELLKDISVCNYVEKKESALKDTKTVVNNKKSTVKKNINTNVCMVEKDDVLTARQQNMLAELIESLTQKTSKSKELASKYRKYLSDLDEVAGFSLLLKEIHYQITVDSSNGSEMIDVDGNHYVDIAMGFGSLLMGYSPDIVMNAIKEEINRGLQLAPRHRLVGEVAQLVCELTGFDRAVFTVTGTEGVMTAMKFARASTGKSKIAIFTGCYHGHNDATLITRMTKEGMPKPMAIGISKATMDDIVLLDYNDMESIEKIREMKDELAAVLIEPVQSRRPEIQPVNFLKAVRKVTEENNILMIFDEVITGFRCHVGGAKCFFNIEPDIAVYGKAACNGMPIGIIAGKKEVMDVADGGSWRYGDNSYPTVERTFYAGTFFKHPYTMAAAHAILSYFKENGNALHEELARKTTYLVGEINKIFKEYHVPIEVNNFTSLYKFKALNDNAFIDIFYYKLLDYGIFTWEGRTCFMSSAHSDADLEKIIKAVRKTIEDMTRAGFYRKKDEEVIEGFIEGIPDEVFYE